MTQRVHDPQGSFFLPWILAKLTNKEIIKTAKYKFVICYFPTNKEASMDKLTTLKYWIAGSKVLTAIKHPQKQVQERWIHWYVFRQRKHLPVKILHCLSNSKLSLLNTFGMFAVQVYHLKIRLRASKRIPYFGTLEYNVNQYYDSVDQI